MVEFYLGTHIPNWLWTYKKNFFVSHMTLGRRKSLFPALSTWMLDSGGFSELSLRGGWTVPAKDYAASVIRYHSEIGMLKSAAIQDWMCEPFILKKTGLSITEHQSRSVNSYMELKSLAPQIPWMPVLQGWEPSDYLRHVEMYTHDGIDLWQEQIVGVGSVCRRQATNEAVEIISGLHNLGLKLHGFGIKIRGLEKLKHLLTSADSLAWSFAGRRSPPLEGCVGHKNCANCYKFADLWHKKILATLN